MSKLILMSALLALSASVLQAQPLFDYVRAPDKSFKWEKAEETKMPDGGSVTHMRMTSQVWQGIEWTHRIAVARPAKPRHPELCVLYITGGNPVGSEFALLSLVAGLTGTPVAVLGDIPNQPLFDGLNEDALISFTFAKYLETKDATWPLLFPMTKAAVRTMDALQALAESEWDGPIKGFMVTGGSKRGWTTWFTGEVDARVKSMAPLVYDNLNLPVQMAHHISQWGAYSEQINDYTERGLPDMLTSDEGRELSGMVDPYTYRDRAKMPKLIVSGTNDPYWPLDAANDYFEELPAPRYLLYVPNSGHGLDDRVRVLNGLCGFVAATAGELPFPKLSWKFDDAEDGVRLAASSDQEPRRVLLWTASSPTKDFRPAKWMSEELEATEAGYSHTQAQPEEGYAAFFMEFAYDAGGRDFPVSTQLRIVGPK